MDKLDIYKCETCGNIIQIISVGGGELVCCGAPMKKQEVQTVENSMMEKHVPVFVKQENGDCEVRVGEVLHPMAEEHYIMFIQTISPDKNCVQLNFLHPNEEPKILLQKLDTGTKAIGFCNIHGLWEGKND